MDGGKRGGRGWPGQGQGRRRHNQQRGGHNQQGGGHNQQRGGQNTPGNQANAILDEAARLKKQAERRTAGKAAAEVFHKSAQLYRNALASGRLSLEQSQEAHFDLGEVLLRWGESVLVSAREASGLPTLDMRLARVPTLAHALKIEAEARSNAANLFRQSHEAYERAYELEQHSQAGAGAGGAAAAALAQEALSNSGSVLCAWAEVALEIPGGAGGGADVGARLLALAEDRYSQALALAPGDTETWTSLGDCRVRRAELLAASRPAGADSSAGERMDVDDGPHGSASQDADGPESSASDWLTARAMYEAARQAYATACSHVDSQAGDDLAGLLVSWSSALLSMAQRAPTVSEEALLLYEEAENKLRSAAKFRSLDVDLFVALGETLCSHAERAHALAELKAQVRFLLEASTNEGFAAARRVDSSHAPARLAEADMHLTAGKLLLSDGEAALAHTHLARSTDLYNEAFQLANSETIHALSYGELCDALYNYACALSLSGKIERAFEVLAHLLRVGALNLGDLSSDLDFKPCRDDSRFEELGMSLHARCEQ